MVEIPLYALTLNGRVNTIQEGMKKHREPFNRLFAAERQLYTNLGFADPDNEATYLHSVL